MSRSERARGLARVPLAATRPMQSLFERLLARAQRGRITVRWPDGRAFVHEGALDGPSAEVRVHDPRAVLRVLAGGSVGLGDSFVDGQWDSPDLLAVLSFAAANLDANESRFVGSPPAAAWHRFMHALRANTRLGARKNILEHYDLGNEFYAAWLDPDLTYSCALFDGTCSDLAEAQRAKWDRLLDLLGLERGQHLLEIGCGWGGFAVHAAKTRGLRVTGITISDAQHAWASRRVSEEGVGDLVSIRLEDYRDVRGTYDGVASIEMFEAVGERYWDTFFACVRDRLRRGGTAALQVITIADHLFERYRSKPDFIQRRIFPGGMLPSPSRFLADAAGAGLAADAPFFFGRDYAMTLSEWRSRFDAAIQQVRRLGFDERFERLWRFYLSYCEAGFSSGRIDVMQVALTRR
ncbi:MAG: cyclopropane-fatty-acyl-phospholipid synthase family protein [Coriobacteriia bacterium]|nr:cyclopropane-fatty-acyl-phospholipid synthase family protein [Coriobacteriia bacterium]